MKWYFLGPLGSFSHSALQHIAPQGGMVPLDSFEEIVSQVLLDSRARGLIGIENTNSSSVHECIDLVFNNDIHIVAEVFLGISLHLIGVPGATLGDVREVYSHPQALLQCEQFIKKHKLKKIPTTSTSSAVQEISRQKDLTKMALAGNDALIDKTTQVVQQHVADVQSNMTRWVVISRLPKVPSDQDNKMTVLFRVKHEPGSLVRVLSAIAQNNGNVTKIESRPVPGSCWEYAFWIDLEIPRGTSGAIIELFTKEALEHRVVGIYEKGSMFNH